MESREMAENNGRAEMRVLASNCHLNQHIEDQGFHIFRLAMNHNFMQGRRVREVAACCLYLACRRSERNTTLLMDFSEVVQVNVFKLGHVYRDLVKECFLSFEDSGIRPVVEIEPLIMKFARKLEFGTSTEKVAEDAVRIVKRMKRDWMITGRRPAGLAGACIILAARMNNFRRTVREVVYIVKVTDVTIQQRLEEFKRTVAGGLTVSEFRQFGNRLKAQADPPAVSNARLKMEKEERKRKMLLEREADEVLSVRGSEEPTTASGEGERMELRVDADGFAIPHAPIDPDLLAASNNALTELQTRTTEEQAQPQEDGVQENSTQMNGPTQEDAQPSKRPKKPASSEPTSPPKRKRGRPPKAATPAPPPITSEDLLVEGELESEMNTILTDPDTLANLSDEIFNQGEARAKALAASLRSQNNGNSNSSSHANLDSETIGEDEFESDPEVSNCLLRPNEIAIKERIWVTLNEDWLRAQQAKLLKKNLDETTGASGPPAAADPTASARKWGAWVTDQCSREAHPCRVRRTRTRECWRGGRRGLVRGSITRN